MLPPFAEHLDANNLRVQAPSDVIFLCGGPINITAQKPTSLRDAFLKAFDNPALKSRKIVLAEDINVSYVNSPTYKDLLLFETDLAQITELILLFSESEGSFAELGAFAMVPDIASRLLVVITDRHYKHNSFIKLGPIAYLEHKIGERVVYVLDEDEIGTRHTSVSDVDIQILSNKLALPIQQRLAEIREPTTFDNQKNGHAIKLMVGLVQEYGALTADEISDALVKIGAPRSLEDIQAFMLCAEAVEWVKKEKRGTHTYYFSLPVKDAAQFHVKDGVGQRNKLQRRLQFRSHWKENDPDRYSGIVKYGGSDE